MTTYGIMAALLVAQAQPGTGLPQIRTEPQPPLRATETLTLEQALRDAGAKNLDLKAAAARLEQSKELHWKAWSSYLPRVVASGTFTRNNNPDVTFQISETQTVTIQKQDTFAAQVELDQGIIVPQAWYAIAGARAGERLAADNIEAARRDILFGTAQAYYGAIGFKQLVGIQERQLAITRDHEKDARVRYDAGAAPKVTLLRAEIDRARAEQDLKRAQNTYLAAKESLATLLDRNSDFEVEIPQRPQLPQQLDPLVETAPRDRPDVRATAEQLTVAEKDHAAVLMRYLPTLGAFARYQYANLTGFTGSNSIWVVGLALNWTILDGFLRESDLRETEARVREAEAAQASAVAKARNDVRLARLDLDSAVANREKAREQYAFAQENQRLVDVNYKAGAATYIEVTDANAALLQASLQLLTEAVNADLAALRVLKAAGLFNPQ